MTDKGIDQKPSETALFAALRRMMAHKEFGNEKFGPDNLAVHFLPPQFRFFLKFRKIMENTKNKLNDSLPGLTEYMIARTAYFDKLFVEALKQQVPQIVLMGAGYDTRAFRFLKPEDKTTIFELDSAPTQNRKLEYLKKARISISEQVKFLPINFNRESMEDVLLAAGYSHEKETLFIWEGVSYYLEEEAVDATLSFVSQKAHSNSKLAFDYTATLSEENIISFYGAQGFSDAMKKHHSGEGLLFSIEEGQVEEFLAQRGLRVIEHLDNDEIEKDYLTDENGDLIGKMTGHFRFCCVGWR